MLHVYLLNNACMLFTTRARLRSKPCPHATLGLLQEKLWYQAMHQRSTHIHCSVHRNVVTISCRTVYHGPWYHMRQHYSRPVTDSATYARNTRRYKNSSDEPFFLRCFDGGSLVRVLSKGTLIIDHMDMGIWGATQPGVLLQFVMADKMQTGWAARFLMIVPRVRWVLSAGLQ
jgi:hypothetical protein